MDALRPGHAHRSSSDRLLNNYLDSQKHLSTSLLTLLSHSHSSTSSLLAYVTSSPGVLQPVRRGVRHAAFEGPLSAALISNPEGHHNDDNMDFETQGWSAYIASLDAFRKDLKQIHLLEEELGRVKRDREILVTRLIKTTKSRPKKSDLTAIASSYRHETMSSSRASLSSMGSNVSSASKESKRAGKLADAQAELLGCEEHLRGLEVRIEQERNKVMMRGLEDRFRAMEAVGRMWVGQAQRGLQDLEKGSELPADAYELDSNASLAPSQSASQIAYEDSHHRGNAFPKLAHSLRGPGSIAGSIVEEDEGSSDEDNHGGFVVHENRPGSRASALKVGPHSPNRPSPLGVPSVISRPTETGLRSASSDVANFRSGGRRAASDVGISGYRPPSARQAMRRTYSDDNNGRAGSDRSSIRSFSPKKKKGFFASIGRFFKGGSGKSRSGRDSPPYGSGSSKGGWHTRTDANLQRSASMYGSGRGRRRGDDSSSDEDNGNLISVSNNRTQGTWSVDNVGKVNNNRPTSRAAKRTSTGTVASGLIPAPTRAGMKRESSQSTITKAAPRSGAATPTPGNPGVQRSNTMKSSASVASVKSAGTAKTNGTIKKTRANGSIAKSASVPSQPASGKTIMSLVDSSGPAMPEVPKAPKSQVTPQLELAKAPGSSLQFPAPTHNLPATSPVKPNNVGNGTLSRSASTKQTANKAQDSEPPRSTTPLPPSRTLAPPLKSALRPTSPTPASPPTQPMEPPKPMFAISAPGPVEIPDLEVPAVKIPAAAPRDARAANDLKAPPNVKRNSYASNAPTSEAGSIYESAVEDGEAGDDDDSSGSEDEAAYDNFQVVDNERVKRLGINVGPPAVERTPSGRPISHDEEEEQGDDESVTSTDTATHATSPQKNKAPSILPHSPAQIPGGSTVTTDSVSRRKSVRMAVPDSPGPNSPVTATAPSQDKALPSPELKHDTPEWNTRIGRMRDDTSDESDHDDGYLKARKGLLKNSGKWESTSDGKKSKRKSVAGSVKSLTSSGSAKKEKRKSAIV